MPSDPWLQTQKVIADLKRRNEGLVEVLRRIAKLPRTKRMSRDDVISTAVLEDHYLHDIDAVLAKNGGTE